MGQLYIGPAAPFTQRVFKLIREKPFEWACVHNIRLDPRPVMTLGQCEIH
jgi:hypothetical protein